MRRYKTSLTVTEVKRDSPARQELPNNTRIWFGKGWYIAGFVYDTMIELDGSEPWGT